MRLERFADCRCRVAEGPLWNEAEQCLYWVDIPEGTVYRKRWESPSNDFEAYPLSIGKIGALATAGQGEYLLFAAAGRVYRWRPGGEPSLFAELQPAGNSRFNDVILAPSGHIFCGVAPEEKGKPGSLWRMDQSGNFACVEAATAGMPNGMGFSPDHRYFYFTVSDERIIYRYLYDAGDVSRPEKWVVVPEGEGLPDGMTVTPDGSVWSAHWDGYKVVRYSPEGGKLREYLFPIAKITSLTSARSMLMVTTANYPFREEECEPHGAGAVFRMI